MEKTGNEVNKGWVAVYLSQSVCVWAMLSCLLFEQNVNGTQRLASLVGIYILLVIMNIMTFILHKGNTMFMFSSVIFDFCRAYMRRRCLWSLVLYVRLGVCAKLITRLNSVTPKMDGKLMNFI